MLEAAFVVFAIYMFSGARLVPSGSYVDTGQAEIVRADTTNPLYFGLQLGVYLVALVLAVRRPRALWRAATADLLLLALLGLTVASMLWSDAPDVVFRRWGALLGTTVFAFYFHMRYGLEEQLRLVGWGLGLGIVVSLILFSPSAVADGVFRGVYENKNSLGRMMALASIVFILLGAVHRRGPIVWAAAGLSLVLMMLAHSSTALVVTLTIVGMLPLLRLLARDMRLTVGLGSFVVLVLGTGVLFATSNPAAAAAAVGRDVTLTGRTDLWQYVVEMILKRPWLGYGYETFWLWELPWRFVVDEGAGWTAPNAHNGYLEVALALGGIGLLLYVAGLGRGLVRGVKYLGRDSAPTGLWPVAYLSFVLMYNFTEIAALTRNDLIWVLYVSALLALAPARRRVGRRARRAVPMPAVHAGAGVCDVPPGRVGR